MGCRNSRTSSSTRRASMTAFSTSCANRRPSSSPHYSRRLLDLQVDPAAGPADHAVTVRLERVDAGNEGKVETIKARYVVGCDGARSTVRKSIGRELHGDSANHAWGVMDVLAVTDFPDIRFKALIQSAKDGSLLIIPREGGYMVRLYVELAKLDVGERVANRNITADDVIAKAQRILKPHTLEVKEIAWWSVYEIGQRLTDKFDDVPEAEIATAPAAHLHRRRCLPYPQPQGGAGHERLDAGRLQSRLEACRRPPQAVRPEPAAFLFGGTPGGCERADRFRPRMGGDSRLRQPRPVAPTPPGRRTISSGTAATPRARRRTTRRRSSPVQPRISISRHGLVIGKRFHSAPVIRLADAKPVHLGHAAQADGRFRIYAFSPAEDPAAAGSAIRALVRLPHRRRDSPVKRYTPAGADIDSVIDLARGLSAGSSRARRRRRCRRCCSRAKGRYGLLDYEKMFCPDLKSGHDVFTMRGIDRKAGCMVVVRPDQYVANVLPLDDFAGLASYFDGVHAAGQLTLRGAAARCADERRMNIEPRAARISIFRRMRRS